MNEMPYSLDDLASGAVRTLIAPLSEPAPKTIADVFDMTADGNYAPQGDWFDVGATTGGLQYTRALTTAGVSIEQTTSSLLEQVTENIRTISVPVAEVRPNIIQMLEEGRIAEVLSAVGHSGFTHVEVGDITDLSAYRVAFVGRRQRQQGTVTEPDGTVRGRYFGFVGYRAQMQGDSSGMTFAKGALASVPLNLKLGPEPGKDHSGYWFDEQAGIIAAA